MARAAVFTAAGLGVRQIVTFTRSGFTARLLSRYRPRAPILAFTPSEQVARRVQILWGTRPFVVRDRFESHGEIVERVERHLLESGNAVPGDKLIQEAAIDAPAIVRGYVIPILELGKVIQEGVETAQGITKLPIASGSVQEIARIAPLQLGGGLVHR